MKKKVFGILVAFLVTVGAIGSVSVVAQSHASQIAGWSTPDPIGN